MSVKRKLNLKYSSWLKIFTEFINLIHVFTLATLRWQNWLNLHVLRHILDTSNTFPGCSANVTRFHYVFVFRSLYSVVYFCLGIDFINNLHDLNTNNPTSRMSFVAYFTTIIRVKLPTLRAWGALSLTRNRTRKISSELNLNLFHFWWKLPPLRRGWNHKNTFFLK